MKETFTLVATAAAGLEAVVGRELRELCVPASPICNFL